MTRSSKLLALSMTTALLAAGCLEEAVAKDETPVQAAPTAETKSADDTQAKTAPKGEKKHGKKGRRAGRDRSTPVFVDGVMVGSLRFTELPPSLNVTWHAQDNENVARRFAIGDYLAAMDISLDSVKGVHFYGGRRITAIDGDEIRAKADKIHFGFSRDTAGRPIYRHDGPVATNTSVDKISSLAIYVNKPVPEMRGGVPHVNGEAAKGMPYAKNVKTGGTRVYVDGRLVTHVKRRHVEDSDAKHLAGVLSSLDIDVSAVKRAQLVSRDKVARELTGAELGSDELEVGVKGGRVALASVADGNAVDAVLLFVEKTPVDRSMDPPAGLSKPGLRPVIDDAK